MNRKNAARKLKLHPIKVERGQDPIAALKANVPSPAKPCMLICFLTPSKVNYSKVKEFSNKYGYISQCLNIKYVKPISCLDGRLIHFLATNKRRPTKKELS